jgi:hypothetical protein
MSASHRSPLPPPGLETADPDAARTFLLEESLAAVTRINRYLLQLLHEDRERGGFLTSLVGLSDRSREELETLLDRPWAEVETRVGRLSSPLWRLADQPACWRTLAGGGDDAQDLARVDGCLWPRTALPQES